MSMLQLLLKIALNPNIIDKNEAGNKSVYAQGWINVDVTVEDFAAAVAQNGFAYCAQLNGLRKGENFKACNIASVDVDHGLTIDEALANPFIRQNALLIYTTVRHKPEDHRFRVVVLLPETITCPRRMRAVNRGLTRRMGGDLAATDPARAYFGNRKAQVHLIGEELSPDLLRELIADAGLPENTDLPTKEIVSRRSAMTLTSHQELRLPDGRRMLLCDVPPKSVVHCPVHPDENPSAFVIQNRHGMRGVYCSSCAKSYWLGGQRRDEYDPDVFVATARAVAAAGKTTQAEWYAWPYQNSLAHERQSGCRVHIVSGQAAPAELLPGITLVRSDKGTGKTEAMKRLATGAKTVLLVGHRRTLIRGSCKRLNLTCYLDLNKKAAELDVQPEVDAISLDDFLPEDEDGR